MSQATTQVKKVKGEGFKWGQELLKAKAIIAEQQEIMKKQQEKIEELTDRANWTNEECINHLQEEGYYVETLEAHEEEIENLKTDSVAAFELLDKDPNYFVCTTEDRDKLWTEEDLKLEGYVLTKGKLTQIISQHDEEDSLYWGATNGYLTIFRLPQHLVLPNDYFGRTFGNKWCLGEEWGGLNSACFQTITQEMIDNENFEQEQGYSDSEDDSDNEDLECAAWCKPIREGREPEERDADEFLSTKQKCPSCELERQEIIAETVQEMAVRIIAEQVKKQEENGEAEASDETEEGCCSNCGLFMPEDMHIFCFTRGDEEETMCCECGQDLHEELKAAGWKRDDDSTEDDE
jgi:hypothetical protein